MMLHRLSPLILFLAALAPRTSQGATTVNDPSTYFGGQDNNAYLEWIASDSLRSLTSTLYLPSRSDPTLGAALHWHIVDDDSVELAVAVKSSGWMGFGLSVNG